MTKDVRLTLRLDDEEPATFVVSQALANDLISTVSDVRHDHQVATITVQPLSKEEFRAYNQVAVDPVPAVSGRVLAVEYDEPEPDGSNRFSDAGFVLPAQPERRTAGQLVRVLREHLRPFRRVWNRRVGDSK